MSHNTSHYSHSDLIKKDFLAQRVLNAQHKNKDKHISSVLMSRPRQRSHAHDNH
jgi:hypothetical protein